MENQEITTSIKGPIEKCIFLQRLRKNTVLPFLLIGGVLSGGETSVVHTMESKKNHQERALLKLMHDPKIKRQDIRLAVDFILKSQGEKGESELLSLLQKPETSRVVQESIVAFLRDRMIKRVNKGEKTMIAIKHSLDVLQNKKTSPNGLVRVMEIVGCI